MPTIDSKAKELERRFLAFAPQHQRAKIRKVIDIYRERRNVPFLTVQNLVLTLYSPSVLGPSGRTKADQKYEDFLSKYQHATAYPVDHTRTLRHIDRVKEQTERMQGKRSYQLNVILYTQARKMDPEDKRGLPAQDAEADLSRLQRQALRRSLQKKKHKGLLQFWKGTLDVVGYAPTIFEDQKWKMTDRGTKEFRKLYSICMTDKHFQDRELTAPGYLDGIYLLDWTDKGKVRGGAGGDPAASRKRAAGEKVAIQFRYCSNTADLSKRTFREALQKGSHHVSECWINTLYDNYQKTLLRPEKTKNLITRATILEVLGRTEENIREGLSIEEVLPFFQKYKLKLRVFDIFYNLIYKYDPEVPNFNHRPFYCVTDGDHIYTLNRDLDSLAQKSPEDDYKVLASPNFHIPDKATEPSNHRIMEHIDELLEILREQEGAEEEEKISYLIQKHDNLEAVVWQLYDAGFRPSIKYGAGRLSWVSLSINKHTFIIKSQQMIDWAIDGMMEVQDAAVFNRMHDAKTEFHYQLFRAEHRSFYSPQDLEILDECRTVANVGWLNTLKYNPVRGRNRLYMPIRKADLAEIDVSKAYTGAFMRIRAIPVFNEFDLWQRHSEGEALRNLSLYLVEVLRI
jgi:hypothetical protein